MTHRHTAHECLWTLLPNLLNSGNMATDCRFETIFDLFWPWNCDAGQLQCFKGVLWGLLLSPAGISSFDIACNKGSRILCGTQCRSHANCNRHHSTNSKTDWQSGTLTDQFHISWYEQLCAVVGAKDCCCWSSLVIWQGPRSCSEKIAWDILVQPLHFVITHKKPH